MFNKYLIIIITSVLFSYCLHASLNSNLNDNANNLKGVPIAEEDSTIVKIMSAETDSENDSSTTEIDSSDNPSINDGDSTTLWSFYADISFQNKSIKKGEVTAFGKATMQLETGLSYDKLAFSAGVGKEAFANVWTDYILGLKYTFSLAGWLDFDLAANQFNYISDTLNLLSENSSSLQGNLIFKLWDFSLDLGYQHLFGSSPVNYLSLSMNYTKAIGNFEVGLTADVTSSDFTKKAKKKLDRFKRLTNSKSMIYTGMLSLTYSLPYNLNVGASGGITQDFKGKVQPIFRFEFGYNLDF